MKKVLPIILIGLAITLSGCTLPWQKPATNNPVACTEEAKLCPDGSAVGRSGPNCEFAECPAQIANPASVNCKAKGGTSEIITAGDGSQSGICKFPDGTQCEEWALYRNECKPGVSLKSDLQTYNNAQYGYSVSYPNSYKTDNRTSNYSTINTIVFEPKVGSPEIPISISVMASSVDNLIKQNIANSSFEKHSQKNTTIGGRQAVEFTGSVSESFSGEMTDIYIANNGLTYILSWTSLADKAVFDQIVSSFKFTK